VSVQSPWIATARLLRRAGFGATGPQVDAGCPWSTYLDRALGSDPDPDPGAVATPMPSLRSPGSPPGKGATVAARRQYNRQLSDRQRRPA
jgi:hypothetical protein